jgi:hypothetical protein
MMCRYEEVQELQQNEALRRREAAHAKRVMEGEVVILLFYYLVPAVSVD